MAHERGDARRHVVRRRRDRRALRDGRKPPADAAGLARQAARRRHGARRPGRDRHPRRRRDRGRDVVALRRPGRARTRSTRRSPSTSATTSATRRWPTRSTCRPTPTPRATARKRPQDQDPDVLLHVVGETDNGIVVRGAKFETAAAYANQAFVKPTIGDWGRRRALATTRSASSRRWALPASSTSAARRSAARQPSARLPAVEPLRRDRHDDRVRRRRDPLGERPLLPPHQGRGVHPRHAAPLQHVPLRPASPALRRPAVGVAYTNAVQTGVKMHQGVREKLAELVVLPRGDQRAPDRRHRAGRDRARAAC